MALSSMAAAVSGLKAAQTALSVIGDNLANLNTAGFKSSRTTFSDQFAQTLRSAQAPGNGLGGKNPVQIGSGTSVSSIDMDFTQGGLTPTGKPFDLAIEGEGFFILTDGVGDTYTRVGAFDLDKNDDLVDSASGLKVKGINGSAINVPVNSTVPAKATTKINLSGNLNSTISANAVNQVLESSSAYTVAGPANAVAASLLNDLTQNTIDYVAGDKITITGSEADGVSVNTTFTYGTSTGQDGTTLGDLRDFISSSFGSATASISSGKIVLTSDAPGEQNSRMSLSIADASSGNTGATTFITNAETVAGSGKAHTTTASIFDSKGVQNSVTLTFEKTAADTWDVTGTMKAGTGTVTDGITGINFNSTDGSFASVTGTSTITVTYPDSTTQVITLDFGQPNSFEGVSQFSGDGNNSSDSQTVGTVAQFRQDGYKAGFFSSATVNADGKVITIFTNGIAETVAQLQMATFSNPAGLTKIGGNKFALNVSSGEPVLQTAGAGRTGRIIDGQLESSNVDLAQEFTSLITTQRSFQANARTITTTDEMLQELVNLVR
ncbi:MAG: flagellar hook-basal body complex protein [Candidatus Scalindua sp.]|nr:flagellar hook-basal body complex protein [Candidatus Scalindua sp.]